MGCCGKKRNEWLNEVKSSSHQNSNENNQEAFIPEKPAREFEYTGDYSLTSYGVASGKPYHFRFKGDKLKIDYTDSFAMMAERDLIIITP